jgi:GTPase
MATEFADRVRAGDRKALARALSLVEDESPAGRALIAALYPHTGRAWTLGVTGPPGAGKSTLVDRLAAALRRRGDTVGILAVDPTSPFTGGAILGDRVRMQGHAGDAGVFIRSMATRGHLGGLARATGDAAIVLEASGCDCVVIETVGVGQAEVDIVSTADVCVVTLVPGTGDEVQALKAGIMEIADVFVVNKADREGADRMAASVEAMLGLADAAGGWIPPVLKTEATRGTGVDELAAAIDAFRASEAAAIEARRRARSGHRLRSRLAPAFLERVDLTLDSGELEAASDRVARRETDPYTEAGRVLDRVCGRREGSRAALDHIGIAVGALADVVAFYRDALGLEVSTPHDVPGDRVRAAFVAVGDASLELLEPTAPDSVIARFIDRRGPGLHHVTLVVEDLAAALDQLKARGVRLIDEAPRDGAHGSRVAFVHPSATGGVLLELKQAVPGTGAAR